MTFYPSYNFCLWPELEKVVYFASTLVRKDFENRDLVRKFSMRKEKNKKKEEKTEKNIS